MSDIEEKDENGVRVTLKSHQTGYRAEPYGETLIGGAKPKTSLTIKTSKKGKKYITIKGKKMYLKTLLKRINKKRIKAGKKPYKSITKRNLENTLIQLLFKKTDIGKEKLGKTTRLKRQRGIRPSAASKRAARQEAVQKATLDALKDLSTKKYEDNLKNELDKKLVDDKKFNLFSDKQKKLFSDYKSKKDELKNELLDTRKNLFLGVKNIISSNESLIPKGKQILDLVDETIRKNIVQEKFFEEGKGELVFDEKVSAFLKNQLVSAGILTAKQYQNVGLRQAIRSNVKLFNPIYKRIKNLEDDFQDKFTELRKEEDDEESKEYQEFIENMFDDIKEKNEKKIKKDIDISESDKKELIKSFDKKIDSLEDDLDKKINDLMEDDDIRKVFEGGLLNEPEQKLSNFDIEKHMDRYKNFYGVYAKDMLYKVIPLIEEGSKGGVIMNLDDNGEPGSHWVSIYWDADKDYSIEYFDSFGRNPPRSTIQDIKKIVKKLRPKKHMKLKINRIQNQDKSSVSCGFIAMRFLMDRFRGKNFKKATGYGINKSEDMAEKMYERFNYIE